MNEPISCFYLIGARSDLTQSWQDENRYFYYSKLYYVEKGEIIVEIYGRTITAGPGDLMLIPAGVIHSFRLPENGSARKSWCHFILRNASDKFFEQLMIEPVLHVKNRTVVNKLFRQLFSSHSMPAPQRDVVATTAICGLVQYYFENTNVSLREVSSSRVRQVIDYIDHHYAEDLTLERLAQIAGYSTTHLSKCFHDETGMPPIRYLNNVRIEQAKHLLRYSDAPVGWVMEQCGFTDAAYFSRIIKKTLGFSPQTYRELYRVQGSRVGKKKV